MLTAKMKREILGYVLQYSKGIIEDDECKQTIAAFDAGDITSDDIETFIEDFRAQALKTVK